jgi:peroxiredoxin
MIGDYAPSFTSRSSFHPAMRLEHLAGRYIALTFIVGSGKPMSHDLATALRTKQGVFDDTNAMHFFVVMGETGEVKSGIAPQKPGHRVYFDKAGDIAALYDIGSETAKPVTYILAPNRRIIAIITALKTEDHAHDIFKSLEGLLPVKGTTPPVLMLQDALEPTLCAQLIGEMKRLFILEKAKAMIPPDSVSSDDFRRIMRLEGLLKDENLNDIVIRRMMKRVIPEIRRSFAFIPEHIDDINLISMREEENARSDPMRYSEVKGKEHSRFCSLVSLNGGAVKFPEFSPKAIPLKAGEALVFSSGLFVEILRLKQPETDYALSFIGVKPLKR